MVSRHDLLHPIHHPRLVPPRRRQKDLHGSRRNLRPQRDRLGALALQTRVLPFDIDAQVRRRIAPPETIRKLRQVRLERLARRFDLVDIHAMTPAGQHKPLTQQKLSGLNLSHLELTLRCSANPDYSRFALLNDPLVS